MLRLNYNRTIIPRERAASLKFLIEKAAKTSEEVAELLGWTNEDVETLVINAPKTEQKFLEFAQKVLEKGPENEERINEFNNLFELIQNGFNEILSQKGEKKEQVSSILFDTSFIPKSFRGTHLALLQEVISFFAEKYKIDGLLGSSPLGGKNATIISEWGKEVLTSNFTKLIKNDVEYVFSFLVVLHLKDILIQIRR